MAVVRPFCALRPTAELASKVAALPYDVMNSDEARRMVLGNPYSFLHVDKAEVDLPKTVDIYDEKVYEQAKINLSKLISADVLVQDETPCLYIYEQTWRGRTQTGLVGCTSIDDYKNNIIKKHEHTRADKEADRIHHVDTLNANTGPIFLTYKKQDEISAILAAQKEKNTPVYDFMADDVRQRVWVISDTSIITKLESAFRDINALYIADGHHRAASAVRVGERRRAEHPDYTGEEEFNFFLSVLFPSDDLAILDYNRLLADLNGLSASAFLEKVSANFTIEEVGSAAYHPTEKHTFGMYFGKKWYKLTANPDTYDAADPVERLDVSILQKNLIDCILGIADPRTDKRIDFVGGIRGLEELERRVDSGEMELAFSMYATTLEDLMAIADANLVMPPKSTWFEPKLLSGLFIHFLA